MMFKYHVVWLSVLVCSALALYSPGDDVIQLDAKDFHKDVVMSKDLWLVEFYAPWCGHCKSLTPEWKKAATALKGVVKVAAVDADEHKTLAGQFGVRGFPTIKVFGDDKYKPSDYQGPRSAAGIVEEGLKQLGNIVRERLNGKSSDGGDWKSQGGGSSGGSGGGSSSGGDGGNQVVELTDSNFEELVLKSNDMWLVEFFAPWCGHCKSLEPHWKKAALDLKGKVKLGAMDSTVHTVYSSRYGVQGFPTIKYFPADDKSHPQDYDAGRTSDDIVKWAMDKVVENIDAPEVMETMQPDSLEKACNDHQLCIVSILPNILDCQSECRNNYIKLLNEMGDKYKRKQWGHVWAEAGAQEKLEQALGIGGFGYPAMAAINARKMKYSLLRGSFSSTGINEFLEYLSYGRGSSMPLKDNVLPEIVEVAGWDGKDGELPYEEELDLDDVELDDLPDMKAKQEL